MSAAACSASLPDSHTNNMPPDANGPGNTIDAPPAMAMGFERFIGTAQSSPSVPFGGSPYCNYKVVLQNILIDVTLDPTGRLTWMNVDDTRIEATVGSCPYPPAPSNNQVFEYQSNAPLSAAGDGTYSPNLTGLSANSPTTALTVKVATLSPTMLNASATWHRTDQVNQLDWTVMTGTPIDLALTPCQIDSIYCLGGSTLGALYECLDGTHMQLQKTCTTGCTETPPTMPHTNENCN
jgi:hypothetical protein